MKLMTAEIAKAFEEFPLYSQDGKGKDAHVVVKYFNAYGRGTWLITEGSKQENGDWLFFGYCHIYEWEWGYVSLKELEAYRQGPIQMVERDLYTGDKKTVKDFLEEE